ncbi:MAG: hypothetical protein ACI9NQ_002162 [Paracoccaceae bacterium]|jgi:hypothetical protein
MAAADDSEGALEIISPNEVRISPNLGGLKWAEGTVPIRNGVVKVRIEAEKHAEISGPEGVTLLPAK